jgi:hypothetical protein
MYAAPASRLRFRRLLGLGLAGALAALALAVGAPAQDSGRTAACPLAPSDLSAIVGRTLQRVNLFDPKADPAGQCAFAVVARGKAVTPQVFLTTGPGDVGDLRDMYAYYVQSRAKLATKPRVTQRSDLGPGAFTLTSTTGPVTTLYFMLGKGTVGTLSVDLTDAPAGKRDVATVEKILALVFAHSR